MSQAQGVRSVIVDLSAGNDVAVGFASEAGPSYHVHFPLPTQLHENEICDFELILLQFFSTIFTEYLRVKPKTTKLLIIEPTFLAKHLRDCIFRVLFKDLQVSSFSFIPSLPLIALASAKSCGLVVLIDGRETEVILFSHNRLIVNSMKLSCGYNSCLMELKSILNQKYSVELDSDSLYPIFSSLMGDWMENRSGASVEVNLRKFELSESELHLCVEALLNGSGGDVVYDEHGLIESIFDCLQQGNIDDIPSQLNNVIFTGRGALFPGLNQIILDGLNENKRESKSKLRSISNRSFESNLSPFNMENLPWIGASLLFSFPSIGGRFIVPEMDGKCFDKYAPDWMSIRPEDWKFFGSSSSFMNASINNVVTKKT